MFCFGFPSRKLKCRHSSEQLSQITIDLLWQGQPLHSSVTEELTKWMPMVSFLFGLLRGNTTDLLPGVYYQRL